MDEYLEMHAWRVCWTGGVGMRRLDSPQIGEGQQCMRDGVRALTGKATATMVASRAHARLTMMIVVKAHKSLQPGLNFSSGCSGAGGFDAIMAVSVLVGSSISSDVLPRLGVLAYRAAIWQGGMECFWSPSFTELV